MKNRIYFALALAALSAGLYLIDRVHAQGGSTALGPTMTALSVGTAATMAAIAANPTRRSLTICNEHATATVTFTVGTTLTPVSLTTGRVLAAGNLVTSCFVIGSSSNVGSSNVGAQINVIASGAATPATVIEYY